MSVILAMDAVTWSQGYSGLIYIYITNGGTENVKQINLKVTDSVIFDSLTLQCYGGYKNCLNVFSTSNLYLYNGGAGDSIPAGQKRQCRFLPNVKAAAPIQIHKLSCDFTYSVY